MQKIYVLKVFCWGSNKPDSETPFANRTDAESCGDWLHYYLGGGVMAGFEVAEVEVR